MVCWACYRCVPWRCVSVDGNTQTSSLFRWPRAKASVLSSFVAWGRSRPDRFLCCSLRTCICGLSGSIRVPLPLPPQPSGFWRRATLPLISFFCHLRVPFWFVVYSGCLNGTSCCSVSRPASLHGGRSCIAAATSLRTRRRRYAWRTANVASSLAAAAGVLAYAYLSSSQRATAGKTALTCAFAHAEHTHGASARTALSNTTQRGATTNERRTAANWPQATGSCGGEDA